MHYGSANCFNYILKQHLHWTNTRWTGKLKQLGRYQ